MPAALTLSVDQADRVECYLAAMRRAGLKTGRSTTQAARSFSAKIQRAGGFDGLSLLAQVDAVDKARSFAQWLMVTGQLTVPAALLSAVYLRLGSAARAHCPQAYQWFCAEGQRLQMRPADVSLQWSTLAKVSALTGAAPDQVGDREFDQARDAVIAAYRTHASPEAGRVGHKTLAMTMIYARIADKTVAEEYFAVTDKVEALYGQPRQLPAADEGNEMRHLRGEMHRSMLGNGYCARPVEMDCHFESICEGCTFFVTTIEFRPTLQHQRDDAANKGPNRPPEDLRQPPHTPRRSSLINLGMDRITHITTTADGCTLPSATCSDRMGDDPPRPPSRRATPCA